VTSERVCKLIHLPGLTEYTEAWDLQRRLAADRADGTVPDDVLLLLEHPRVITLGRSSSDSNLLASPDLLRQRGVEVHEVERGGDVTYHGPGQLVGYPIIDLGRHKQDLHWYLRQLEEVLIRGLRDFGIVGRRIEGYTGVWVENRKIASIGVHVTRWVTYHGFALNASTNLTDFELIVPCGIDAVQMTSIAKETGQPCDITAVVDRVAVSFGDVFDLAMQPSDLQSLS
jgi:lipoyl(octanoyl) transferase